MPDTPRQARPSKPWRPARLKVSGVYPRTRKVWIRDGRTGARERKPQRCFDARFRVDNHAFRRTFEQRGWADDYVTTLHEGFANGWPFDPDTRRFIPPDELHDDDGGGPTFLEHARDYIDRKWLGWSPKSRRNGQRELPAPSSNSSTATPTLTAEQRRQADGLLASRRVHRAARHSTT